MRAGAVWRIDGGDTYSAESGAGYPDQRKSIIRGMERDYRFHT